MHRGRGATRWGLALAMLLGPGACDGDPAGLQPPVRYTVEVSGEEFVVQVSTQAQIQDMEARLSSGTEGVINGRIEAGDAGYNEPWSWHMVPSTVEAVDAAIEVCDGRPSMVEADLDYWLNTVGQFCPWGATVVARSQ